MGIKATITNAAEITILAPIDANYKTGGGDINVGACLVVAEKGIPFKAMQVYGGTSSLQDQFGLPLPKKSPYMEGLRHVHDASEECSYVNAIRVVDPLTYRFPSISCLITNDRGAWNATIRYKLNDIVTYLQKQYICVYAGDTGIISSDTPNTSSDWELYEEPVKKYTNRWNATITCGSGAFAVFYVVDGDTSVNRSFKITSIDTNAERFTIEFYDKDELGEEYLLESYTVGISEDDKDDMGLSAYIETVLERNSDIFRCDFDESQTWSGLLATLQGFVGTKVSFTGGTTGDTPSTQDFITGANILRNDKLAANLIFAAGIYDITVIAELASIADERHVAFFYDVPPGLKSAEAIAWNRTISMRNRHARAYYSPISATDQWRGGTCVWGVSGAMAAAKARCNKIVTVGSVPGVHYSPAGEQRGYLTRTGISQLYEDDVVNRDNLYDARINPIWPSVTSGMVADDDLTQWPLTNYLRFGWINDVLDYIDHRFLEGAQQIKFEPDGLTREGLMDVTRRILDDLVTSGALVAPREPDRDGLNPYIITIEQLEIDLWKVTWEVCITGAARRIVGQPKLIR